MLMHTLLKTVNALLLIYMLLLSIRILLTWFRGPSFGRAFYYLRLITDPYLNLFRGIRFLHLGGFDLTPLAAIVALVIAQNILGLLIAQGTLAFGIVMSIILRGVWQSVRWILGALAVICVIRIIGLYTAGRQDHPVWRALDTILHPLVFQVNRVLNRSVEYLYGVFITLGAIILAWIVGTMVVNLVAFALYRLPF